MRRIGHLRAQPQKMYLQKVWWVGHLRAELQKEQVQGLPAEGGLVLARRTEELSLKESETLQLGDVALSGAVTGASCP
jgi:hypothetical protein